MGEKSAIEWTDATVNFWWGCTKVGPGCDHCYAETWAKRTGGGLWGVGEPRRKIKSAVALIHRLDNDYSWWSADHNIGQIHPTAHRRVFIQSMSDLFDTEVPLEWFAEAWQHITACNRLAIQIVTKRISVVEKRLAAIGGSWPKHAGLIISVVNQAEADRDIPRLLALKAKLGIPWVGLSIEPMLGPIDLNHVKFYDHITEYGGREAGWESALNGLRYDIWADDDEDPMTPGHPKLDWVIAGGESGSKARPIHPDWVRSLRDQCAAADVPFLFKQWGEWEPLGENGNGFWPSDEGGCIRLTIDGERSQQGWPMQRVGKKRAGRVLDGVQHDGLPYAIAPRRAAA